MKNTYDAIIIKIRTHTTNMLQIERIIYFVYFLFVIIIIINIIQHTHTQRLVKIAAKPKWCTKTHSNMYENINAIQIQTRLSSISICTEFVTFCKCWKCNEWCISDSHPSYLSFTRVVICGIEFFFSKNKFLLLSFMSSFDLKIHIRVCKSSHHIRISITKNGKKKCLSG